jgi:hypothetical protein
MLPCSGIQSHLARFGRTHHFHLQCRASAERSTEESVEMARVVLLGHRICTWTEGCRLSLSRQLAVTLLHRLDPYPAARLLQTSHCGARCHLLPSGPAIQHLPASRILVRSSFCWLVDCLFTLVFFFSRWWPVRPKHAGIYNEVRKSGT